MPLPGALEGIVADGPTHTVVVALRGQRLALLDAVTGQLRTTVDVGGTARHLQLAAAGGPVLVPGEDTDEVAEVSLPAGQVVGRVHVGRQPHDAAYDPASGRVVVSDELGGAVSFVRGDSLLATRRGPVQPGGLAVEAGRAGVVDVRGNAVYVYDVASARQIARLAFGAGLTHAVAIGGGRIAVADTRGNAVFVVALDGTPRVLGKVAFPLGSPYGMAADVSHDRLYVAASGANQLVTYTIGSEATLTAVGAPLATVQQPNSVAVDPETGSIFVASATRAGGVQVISRRS